MYTLKFTKLQRGILRFLFIKSKSFNLRGIARPLQVSLTAVSKALKGLQHENLVLVEKDPDSKRLSIELNKENPEVFFLKRIDNIKLLYESQFVHFLSEKFPTATIILFGSYAFGEDTYDSDIDVAIIGSKEKNVDILKFERLLEHEIVLHFYDSFKNMDKNLKSNILNGITLDGAVEL